ncbi:MAG: hypothetical protein ACI4W6_02160 [Acutalibacteraceae bacterium]
MALVNCPYCDRENVSDDALFCPQCKKNVYEYFYQIRNKERQENYGIKLEKECNENAEKKIKRETSRINSQIKQAIHVIIGFSICTLVLLVFMVMSANTSEGNLDFGDLSFIIAICFCFYCIYRKAVEISELKDQLNEVRINVTEYFEKERR